MKTKLFWSMSAFAGILLILAGKSTIQSDELKSGNATVLKKSGERVAEKTLSPPEEIEDNRVILKDVSVEKLLPLPTDESSWISTLFNQPNFDVTLFPPLDPSEISPELAETSLIPNFPQLGEAIHVGIQQASQMFFNYAPWMWIRNIPAAALFQDVSPHWTFNPELDENHQSQ